MAKIISASFFLLGLFFLTIFFYQTWLRTRPVSYQATSINQSSDIPARIVIRSSSIDLPISPNPSSAFAVSYLSSSARPGESGNSILYGHNWSNLLGKLNRTKVGDEIEIYYPQGKEWIFRVTNISEVEPSETSLLLATSDKRITLYTCSGLLDTRRLVVTAILEDQAS